MFRIPHRILSAAAAGPLVFAVVAAFAADDKALPADSGLAADVVVNGQPISVNHVRLMSANIDAQKGVRNLAGEEARNAARAELITEEVLAQAARKQGLDKRPDVVDQLAFQRRAVLSRAYLEDYFEKNPVNDTTLKTAYEWRRANGKIVEYRLRQILTSSEDAARQAIAALDKGEDFAAVAKRYTQDPGGQSNGGDLGWFRPDIFVDHHFTSLVESLGQGQYNKTPGRSRFGWHVVKVEEGPRVVARAEPYDALSDSAREALRQRTAQQKIETLTAELAASAKVTGPGAAAAAQRSAK